MFSVCMLKDEWIEQIYGLDDTLKNPGSRWGHKEFQYPTKNCIDTGENWLL